MPEINLLGSANNKGMIPPWQIIVRVLFVFAILAVVGVVAWYAYAFIEYRKTSNSIVTVGEEITSLQKEFLANPKRQEVLLKQGQLQEVNSLLDEHLMWSKFLPRLARTTLRSVRYIELEADNKGEITLVAEAPDYKDIERFLAVFDLAGLNEQFRNIKVVKIEKSTEGDVPAVQFTVTMSHKLGYLKSGEKATSDSLPSGGAN